MGDFFQNGEITTLQELGKRDYPRFEAELTEFSKERPLALVMPALYSGLGGPALKKILSELSKVEYLDRLVISLGGADRNDFKRALELFSGFPRKVSIIWNDGKRIQELERAIHDKNLYLGEPGKGIGAWIAYGLILSDPKIRTIALHDCDIVSYDRIMLHRLVYPVMNPLLDFEFSKGYYARFSDHLYGRVTRIFVTPLIRALQKILGRTPFLVYLDSFRYPLAGEFCMNVDAARVNKVPSDWGLEIGTISEVFRNYSTRRICQVDLGVDYEHRHQMSGFTDPRKGLMRMARETSLSIFHTLGTEGIELSESFFRTLRVAYATHAHEAIRQYSALSAINGIRYDRYAEEVFADYFIKTLERAGADYLSDPSGNPDIPNWNRVKAVIPDIFERIREAVEADENESR
jgi:glucosyl-3-phosphoglycerate synthase